MSRLIVLLAMCVSLIAATPVPQDGGGEHKATYNVLFCDGSYIVNTPENHNPLTVMGFGYDFNKQGTERLTGDIHKDTMRFDIPGGQPGGDSRHIWFSPFARKGQEAGWNQGGLGARDEVLSRPWTHDCKKIDVVAEGNPSCRVVLTCVPT